MYFTPIGKKCRSRCLNQKLQLMKKILLAVLLFVFVGLSAQNLSLNELISLRKMDLDQAETFLTDKGWNYKGGSTPDEGTMGIAKFVYTRRGDFNYAESFLYFYYSSFGQNRVNIQINNKAKYLEYLTGIKKFAPSPINTKVEGDDLVKIYAGKTTTFEVTTSTGDNRYGETGSVWLLLIVENSDYENQFGYY